MWPLSGTKDGATFLPSVVDCLGYRSILALYPLGGPSARLMVGSGLTVLPSEAGDGFGLSHCTFPGFGLVNILPGPSLRLDGVIWSSPDPDPGSIQRYGAGFGLRGSANTGTATETAVWACRW